MKKFTYSGAKKFFAAILAVCLMITAFGFTACGDTEPEQKTVKKVEVTKAPDKTEYFVGEEFTVAGGELTVTYSDGTTDKIAMNAEGVTVSEVKIAITDETEDSEEKTVTVKYGGRNARFKITVSYQLIKVTFNYGHDGAQSTEKSIRKDSKVEKPADPERENYKFDTWYSDDKFTAVFDFEKAVTEDITLYARWLENAVYHDVKFSRNFTYCADNISTQKIKDGDKASKPATDPVRSGFEFKGWFTTAECTTEFDFENTVISANTTVYAKWNRTLKEGLNEFVFEAEDTDLRGKTGPGLSGTSSSTALIQSALNLGASNDRFIGYQYEEGCSIEFRFLSDVEVNDAKIVVRLSAEIRDYDMNPDNYKIMLNGTSINYNEIKFTDVPVSGSEDVGEVRALPFNDYVVIEGAKLNKGFNAITLQTANEHPLSGTTILADAPLIDCIKITTSAVLSWSERHNLPAHNY